MDRSGSGDFKAANFTFLSILKMDPTVVRLDQPSLAEQDLRFKYTSMLPALCHEKLLYGLTIPQVH